MAEQQQEEATMTYDEVSMQQSQHFLHNLQELKNLRPQLYSAAEYCEFAHQNTQNKQMVMENLKEYTVKALINTVDHLGCVSYKLDDLLNQQANDIYSTQIRIACLNQKLRKCQEYTDREGLMQQSLIERTPRYHKHYILPRSGIGASEASVEKLAHNGPDDERTTSSAVRPGAFSSDSGQEDEKTTSSAAHPEVRVAINANSNTSFRDELGLMPSSSQPESFFFFLDTEVPIPSVSSLHSQVQSAGRAPGLTTSSSFAGRRDSSRISKSASMRVPNDDNDRLDICKPPTRSKSLLCFLLSKRKSAKQRINRAF